MSIAHRPHLPGDPRARAAQPVRVLLWLLVAVLAAAALAVLLLRPGSPARLLDEDQPVVVVLTPSPSPGPPVLPSTVALH